MNGIPVGRIQWSKMGISIYAADGSFICRIENELDIKFLTNLISAGLRELSKEQQRRKGQGNEGLRVGEGPEVIVSAV